MIFWCTKRIADFKSNYPSLQGHLVASSPAFYSSSKQDPQYQSLGGDTRRGSDNREMDVRGNSRGYLDSLDHKPQGPEVLLNDPLIAPDVRAEFEVLQGDSLPVHNNNDERKQNEQQPSNVMEI